MWKEFRECCSEIKCEEHTYETRARENVEKIRNSGGNFGGNSKIFLRSVRCEEKSTHEIETKNSQNAYLFSFVFSGGEGGE